MAVKSVKKESNGKGNAATKSDEYRYSNDTFNFWSDETMLQIGVRRNVTKGKLDIQVTIVNRDEDGKFVKLEDGKIDRGVFFLGVEDCIRIKTGLEDILDEESNISGVLIQHVNEETNSGSQLEIINDNEGFTVSISYFENGEFNEDLSWTYVCKGNIDIREYNSDFDIETQSVDRDISILMEFFSNVVPILVLGPSMLDTVGGDRQRSSQNNNGAINLRKAKRKTLGSKMLDDEDDDEEEDTSVSDDSEDDEEEKPIKKKITKKKSSVTKSGTTSKAKKKATKENIKSLLDDDDE